MRKLPLFFILCLSLIATRASAIDALSVSYGQGTPKNLNGVELGAKWRWGWQWVFLTNFRLEGFWDAHAAYWTTDGRADGKRKNIFTVSGAPDLRLAYGNPQTHDLAYYADISVGPAIYSASQLAYNNLGAWVGFEEHYGGGIEFGNQAQFDLSYHYVRFTNYHIFKHNDRFIIGWMLTFAYHLSSSGAEQDDAKDNSSDDYDPGYADSADQSDQHGF